MRTTLDIDDRLLSEANEHVSLTRLIEEDLSMRLRTSQRSGKMRPVLPVYAGRGELRPTIRDTLTQRTLLEAADEADSAQ